MTTRHGERCAVPENEGNGGVPGAGAATGLPDPAQLPSSLGNKEVLEPGALPRASCSTWHHLARALHRA